jgi:hypothetical protein
LKGRVEGEGEGEGEGENIKEERLEEDLGIVGEEEEEIVDIERGIEKPRELEFITADVDKFSNEFLEIPRICCWLCC